MSHLNRLRIILVTAVALAVLPACGNEAQEQTDQAGEAQAGQGTAAQGPPLQGLVPNKMRTIQLRDSMVERGKSLFAQCMACHGKDGGGLPGVGPRLNSESFLAAASDDFLVRTISKGRPGTTMVSWGQMMPPEDIYALVAYIRAWAPVEPAVLDETPLNGNEERGEEIFINICSSCHGRSGAGYQETANGTGIGRKVFLDEVSNGYLRYIIQHGKSQTKMKGFESSAGVAALNGQQIDDVITYLRINAW